VVAGISRNLSGDTIWIDAPDKNRMVVGKLFVKPKKPLIQQRITNWSFTDLVRQKVVVYYITKPKDAASKKHETYQSFR